MCISLCNKDKRVKQTEIDRSGFLPLLKDQKLLQNQKQKLLPVTEAPVHAGALV